MWCWVKYINFWNQINSETLHRIVEQQKWPFDSVDPGYITFNTMGVGEGVPPWCERWVWNWVQQILNSVKGLTLRACSDPSFILLPYYYVLKLYSAANPSGRRI